MQQLDRYRRAAWQQVEEAEYTIGREQLDRVADELAARPRSEWIAWQRDHWKETQAWLKATPRGRASRESFQKLEPKLSYAGWQNLIRAGLLLDAVDGVEFLPGGPYRDFAAGMAQVYWDLAMDFGHPQRYEKRMMPMPPWPP